MAITKKRTKKAENRKKKATPQKKKWSKRVTETSDALDLKNGVFKGNDPRKIALSLKRSAVNSHRRKSSPYRSAMSMLTFYINRAGGNLSQSRLRILERAKDELKDLFKDKSTGK